ncbi:MAG: carboxylesterase family protein [Saprospiraceae bacterium]|nr:carboxylesterase family protein [Saprospiraceae bacterium]
MDVNKINIKLKLFFCFVFAYTIHCSAQLCNTNRYIDSTFSVTKTYNIEYQQAKSYGSFFATPYRLDIYEPSSDTLTHRPLILFLFGGGFLIGDKLFPPADDYCSYWAERGYICAAVNYRLGFNTLISASAERAVYRTIQDLQAALRFFAEYRNQYGVDTSNIIISGNSAGAIAGLHNAFLVQSQAPSSYQGVGFGLDSDNLGGIFSSGNNYWNNEEVKTHGLISNWGAIWDTVYIGDSPKDNIPTILFHGDQDSLVPYNTGNPFGYPLFPQMYGSVPISDALARNNIISYFETFEGAGHEPELLNSSYLDTIHMMSQDFIYEHVLKPEVISVSGNTTSANTITENYLVTANENIVVGCVNVNNGSVLNINGDQFDILWHTIGQDTIEIVVFNDILAKDTFWLPVNIVDICSLTPLTGTNNTTICINDSIIINGTVYNAANPSGIEVYTNIGPNNCDSTVTVALNVLSVLDTSINTAGLTINSNQNGVNYQWMNCDSSNILIPGATNATYTANAPGSFAVILTIGSCIDTSSCIFVTNTGLVKNTLSLPIKIFPNPSHGFVIIDFGSIQENLTLNLISHTGQLLETKKIDNQSRFELEISGAKGIYLIEILNDKNQTATFRVIKE